MKRFLFLLVILSLALGWLALRFSFRGSFVEGVVGEPVDLIPGQGKDNDVDLVLEKLLYRSLFSYNGAGQIKADLVKTYTISKDGKIYTLTIGDFFWRDGKPITSTDVIFTFVQDPAFADIRIEQVGDKQIRFILDNPLSSFLSVLTAPVAPAHFRDLPLDSLGSTFFYIKELKREVGRISQLNLAYEGEGSFKELIFKFFRTKEDLFSSAVRGEVDAFSLGEKADNLSFTEYELPVLTRYFGVFFNLGNGNALAKNSSFRREVRAVTPLVSGFSVKGPFSGTWAQSSWSTLKPTGKKFSGTITLTAVDDSTYRQTVQKVKQDWEKKLKVKVVLNYVSERELGEVLADRDFEAIILGQEVNQDPDRYNLWHSSRRESPGQNITGYANARADRALEEGRKNLSRSARLTHYRNFQRLFGEDNPAVFLYHPAFYYYVSKNFTGIDLAAAFDPSSRFWNFSKWGRSVSF